MGHVINDIKARMVVVLMSIEAPNVLIPNPGISKLGFKMK